MCRQKNFKRTLRSILSLSLVFVFIFSTAMVPRVFAADSLNDLQDRYDALEKKIAENTKKLENIQSDMNSQYATIDILDSQIEDVEAQIELLNERLSVINSDIATLNNKIEEINNEIAEIDAQIEDANNRKAEVEAKKEETINLLLQRMRAYYMSGSVSEIEILFSSSDFSSFFTRAELLKRLSEHDNQLVKDLQNEVKEIETLTAQLEDSKSELDKRKTELDVEKQALLVKQADAQSSKDILLEKQESVQAKVDKANNLLAKLDSSSEEYKNLIAKYSKEEAEIDAKIDDIIRKKGSTTNGGGSSGSEGKMLWPVPYSNCYISAGYGYYSPFGYSQMHNGIDICVSGGSLGKNIIAAKSGTVTTAAWHSSYGNYILIDHGNGIFTLYAHCQTLLVSAGDTVERGQTIAKIGATGRVTGPHLHFEVRVNNGSTVNRVNPLNYVTKP